MIDFDTVISYKADLDKAFDKMCEERSEATALTVASLCDLMSDQIFSGSLKNNSGVYGTSNGCRILGSIDKGGD